jgi:hypothetical protein
VNLYTAELGNPQPPEKLSHIAAAPKLPSVPSAPPTQKSIAILAFVNMSNDPENEFVSDGIGEEIINVLTKIKALRVALAGSSSEALDYLDRAIQNGFGQREWMEHDSGLDSIRDDPRFQALLRKL